MRALNCNGHEPSVLCVKWPKFQVLSFIQNNLVMLLATFQGRQHAFYNKKFIFVHYALPFSQMLLSQWIWCCIEIKKTNRMVSYLTQLTSVDTVGNG